MANPSHTKENFFLCTDTMVAANHGTRFAQLDKFWDASRPWIPQSERLTIHEIPSVLRNLSTYVDEYSQSSLNARFPLGRVSTSKGELFSIGFVQKTDHKIHSQANILTVLTSAAICKAYAIDVLQLEVSDEDIQQSLNVYCNIPCADWTIRYVDLLIQPQPDRSTEAELNSVCIFELRGLHYSFFDFPKNEDDDDYVDGRCMELFQACISSIFSKHKFPITHDRLEPCVLNDVKYLLLVPKWATQAKFMEFQSACREVESYLNSMNLLSKEDGGVYGRGCSRKMTQCELVEDEKREQPKPTRRLQPIASSSRRLRIQSILNPDFVLDKDGDSEIRDPSKQVVSIVTDPPHIVVDVPYIGECSAATLRRFERRFSKSYSDVGITCTVIRNDPSSQVCQIQLGPFDETAVPLTLARKYNELYLDGRQFMAMVTSTTNPPIVFAPRKTRRRRSFCDMSMHDAACADSSGVPCLKKLRLEYGVEFS